METEITPRYFFHLTFGEHTLPDNEGVELTNRRVARDGALAVVRDLTNLEQGEDSRRWASWFLDVADETGIFFRTPIGYPALEVVPSDERGSAASISKDNARLKRRRVTNDGN